MKPQTSTWGNDSAAIVRALEDYHQHRDQPSARVAYIARRRSAYASTAALEEIDATLMDGRQLPLIFKDLRPSAVLPGARSIRPADLCDPAREPLVYKHLLDDRGVAAAACFGAVADSQTGAYHILIERIEGLQLCHVGEHDVWAEAARALAALHVTLRSHARDAAWRRLVPLLEYDAAYYRTWLTRAAEAVAHDGDRSRQRAFERLAAEHDGIAAVFAEQPPTFIHGECYASNIMVRTPEKDRRICLVDWEVAAIGPGAFDVAALTSGDWTPEIRRRLLQAYLDELQRRGVRTSPLAEFERLVDACRLQLALQLVAWHRDWTPPREHTRDWLGEALALFSSSRERSAGRGASATHGSAR